ncbi:RluA family pseudouridine synthase [Helicobacter cappadocius]|uniref:RNA pseudouridylate synthase n=1 Tax=Helicobacter cappadocius TaxID=3063998 RepID=A0AA90PL13_9HELI|nr:MULTISPECIES: RluA family pseudouridine synthase [unclassified Helicobacter]MDO7253458.1 RluA family pseudouridine synthase [Helicobacter sp. faydin-H75]MDP2539385.1 RluA family pseudouridine synthase [Helicobacter sp. faydin-H76]
MEKAYKLLSLQEKISNGKAKALIDKGLVSCNGKKITIARSEMPSCSIFQIIQIQKPKVIFEDENILAIQKPPFIESYELAQMFPEWVLLHRLDRETSGVILLVKDKTPFHNQAKMAFKNQNVYKEYLALVEGIVNEEIQIDKPILTIKTTYAKSKISKDGLPAHTSIKPISIMGKKTLLEVVIKTGRTHQIRVHLKSINHPIIGDNLYGGLDSKRLMLHAHKISLLGYDFTSAIPNEFNL